MRLSTRLVVLTTVALAQAATAQDGPPPHVRATIRAIENMLGSADAAPAIRGLIAEKFTAQYRAAEPLESHVQRLRAIHTAIGGVIDNVMLERDEQGILVRIEGRKTVTLRLVLDAKGLIEKMVEEAGPPSPAGAAATPAETAWSGLSWDTLAETVRAAGFQGTLLARRDGREVTRLAIGPANRDAETPAAPNTVYCIGSTPIDFTVTGIMLLGQRGRLSLDHPISRYLPGVPADKRAITVRHLLTGRSGLPDFVHTATDWDPDLAWIDRGTFIRRTLNQRLLFRPGAGPRHSHAAFGVLAAIIESITGSTYPTFVRTEILTPLGMTRTGFYGESLGLSLADFAVGDGATSAGMPNIPPNWGPTSWLVMGSGGMMSTLEDMDRYHQAIAQGRLLTGEWAKWQQRPGVGVGGSDRGFFIYHAADGRGSSVLYLTNSGGQRPANQAMMKAITRLVVDR